MGALPRAVNEKIQELKDKKNKFSSSMGIEMMTVRSQVARNGPPLHLFDAGENVKHWTIKDHRHALKSRSSKGSNFIKRKKEEEEENFTSKLGSKSFQRNTLKFEFCT